MEVPAVGIMSAIRKIRCEVDEPVNLILYGPGLVKSLGAAFRRVDSHLSRRGCGQCWIPAVILALLELCRVRVPAVLVVQHRRRPR